MTGLLGVKIVGIETSALAGSVAALEDNRLLDHMELNPAQRSAQSLAVGLQKLWQNVGWNAREVDLLAVSQGPGSFTGLRVGVTTAKTLAYAIGAQLIGVNTLEVIASQSPEELLVIHAVMDACRGQLFAAGFRREEGVCVVSRESEIIDDDQWLRQLQSATAVTGPGLSRLIDRVPADICVVDATHWRPQAVTVAQLGYRDYCAGRRDDLWNLLPKYFRPSAAEQRLAERQADQR